MSNPYVGEIRMFAGNFAPAGWMFCEGQLLSIAQYDTLFNLIGTTYGGDGVTTFALPDLRGRVPIHQGSGFVMGQNGGVENVTLTRNELPTHTHVLQATSTAAQVPNIANAVPATGTISELFWGDPPDSLAASQAISTTGGGSPHSNLQPYLCVSFIISLFGIYPPPA